MKYKIDILGLVLSFTMIFVVMGEDEAKKNLRNVADTPVDKDITQLKKISEEKYLRKLTEMESSIKKTLLIPLKMNKKGKTLMNS